MIQNLRETIKVKYILKHDMFNNKINIGDDITFHVFKKIRPNKDEIEYRYFVNKINAIGGIIGIDHETFIIHFVELSKIRDEKIDIIINN